MTDAPPRAPGQVLLQRHGALATVTLSHPGKLNAMSRAMWRALREVAEALAATPGLRAVLLRGEGGHFCAGGDIAEYPGFRFDEAALRHFHETEVWGGLSALLACDLPLVACIEGSCMGAGVEIASCCDLRIAADTARFGAPIAKLGFPMAPREAALVAHELGATVARDMLLRARVFDAAELLARGFLSEVVASEAVAATAQAAAERVASLAPQAARLNKQTLRALQATGPDAAQLQGAYRYADSPEHREGISAFLAKRPPVFPA